MSFSLKQLQEESAVWVEANFAPRPAHRPLLGIVEEVGELIEATRRVEVEDAIGDTVIFSADLANALEIDLETIDVRAKSMPGATLGSPKVFVFMADFAVCTGRICHAFLKMEQGIRGTRAEHIAAIEEGLMGLFAHLRCRANSDDIDFMGAVESTWMRVKNRVWRCRQEGCSATVVSLGAFLCAAHS